MKEAARLVDTFVDDPWLEDLAAHVQSASRVAAGGLWGSSQALALGALARKHPTPIVALARPKTPKTTLFTPLPPLTRRISPSLFFFSLSLRLPNIVARGSPDPNASDFSIDVVSCLSPVSLQSSLSWCHEGVSSVLRPVQGWHKPDHDCD